MPASADVSPALGALAELHGVATPDTGVDGRAATFLAATVRAVLAAMDVPAAEDEVAGSLQRAADAAQARRLAGTVVARRGHPDTFGLPALDGVAARVHLEDGTTVELPGPDQVLPIDLPLGYHRPEAGDERAHLIVAPGRCPLPADLDHQWGWMVQLYALRSADSWGMGDLADLGRLAARSAAELGAGFVVANPLHAATPVLPVEPSPYYPSSRRFTNPLYLSVTDVDELHTADPAVRDRVTALAAAARAAGTADRIDRDAVFRAKTWALELLHGAPRTPAREQAFAAYRDQEGQGLVDFATFCALAERHGTTYARWPADVRHPTAPGVEPARGELADRVAFHTWLQWLCDTQLAAAQRAATHAGMPVGLIHDLAVGVDPGGADAWALQDDLAGTVTVGAPPDAFNRQGQDWRLPPLRPDRLAATGYAAFRDMLASVLRHAGGLRVDHVLGLFRLYWIPEGAPAAAGTYVRYPGEDLLGVLALEAERASALVVGEDLGTVEPGVRDRLRAAGVLGSSVLYFERTADGSAPLPATDYPDLALASVTTHDLPTAAGWGRGEAVRVQAELGLLDDPAAEQARAARDRDELAAMLRAQGLVGHDPTVEELVVAMHAFLAAGPALLVAAALGDAVGDPRQPNLPGTTDAYPSWRLPLADADGQVVLLDELLDRPGTQRLATALRRS
ncbi:MAG: 4-alpha-glucanotransferase [Egibacteraceae bacterium]